MELLKRFVVGLGIGVALVGLVMFALSFAPPSGADSVANPPSPPSIQPPDLGSAPRLPGPPGVNVVPPAPIQPPSLPAPNAALLDPRPNVLPGSTIPPVDIQPVKKEVAKPTPGRTAVRFGGPEGMKVSWHIGTGFHDRDLVAPASFNFVQGEKYRLRLSGLPKYPTAQFYPTLEVAEPTERAVSFLAHNAVPVTFTDAELATAAEGRMVVKVVYLPVQNDVTGQTVATEEVSSVRLGMNADPLNSVSSRGVVLAVIRLGNVDLENPESPALTAPPSGSEVPPLRRMEPPSGPH